MAQQKYIEGQIYELAFVKRVFIDEDHLVFEDEDTKRFIIPSLYYKYYHLKKGQKIKCLVTRVNCKGKIFFEPEHPYYKPGRVYEFGFVRMQITEDEEFDPIAGKEKTTKYYELIVADKDGLEHTVKPHEWQKKKNYKAEKIKCRLVNIAKGRFQLINLEEKTSIMKKILGK